jgi:hypothetical protein
MKPKNLAELSDQELAEQLKKLKNGKIIDAALVGVTIGVVAYSAVANGFSFFTFFPLIITYAVVKNAKHNSTLLREIEREIQSRQSANEI